MRNPPKGKLLRLRVSRLATEGDGLFCLPLGFRDTLLDIVERMEWGKTWIDDDGKTAVLSDEQTQQIELGIMRLTDMCEIIVNNNFTVPAPTVIVNVTGGGSATCNNFPTPIDPDGNPYPIIPVNPADPLEEDIPTWDEETNDPPPGYPDIDAWINDRCRAANWFVDSYIELVQQLDLIERQVSIGAAILEVAAVILALLPGPVGDWAGVVVIVRWVTRMVRLLADVVDDLEDLGDWLQIGADVVQDHREELVCAVYQMTTVEYLKEFFLSFIAGTGSTEMIAQGVPDGGPIDLLRKMLGGTAETLANKAADGFANQHIPDDYAASTNCDICILQMGGNLFIRDFVVSPGWLGGGSADPDISNGSRQCIDGTAWLNSGDTGVACTPYETFAAPFAVFGFPYGSGSAWYELSGIINRDFNQVFIPHSVITSSGSSNLVVRLIVNDVEILPFTGMSKVVNDPELSPGLETWRFWLDIPQVVSGSNVVLLIRRFSSSGTTASNVQLKQV